MPDASVAGVQAPPRTVSAGRLLVGLGLIDVIAAIVAWGSHLRAVEAAALTPLVSPITGGRAAITSDGGIVVGGESVRTFDVVVIDACSAAVLALIAVVAVLVICTRLPLARLVAGLLAGVAVLAVATAAGTAGTVWLIWAQGALSDRGSDAVGWAVAVLGFIGALAAAGWTILSGRRRERGPDATPAAPRARASATPGAGRPVGGGQR